ncbi:MAG: hypothetical protein QOF21_990 [Actinomycetota bacterium]
MPPASKPSTPKRQVELGDRLRLRRESLDLTQEGMANKADVERSYYAQLEVGRRNPSLDTLCRLALALNCDVGDLVSGLEKKAGPPRRPRRSR